MIAIADLPHVNATLNAISIVFLGAGYYFKSWWGLVGLVPLSTAIFRFCPAYLPIGLNTCELKKKE